MACFHTLDVMNKAATSIPECIFCRHVSPLLLDICLEVGWLVLGYGGLVLGYGGHCCVDTFPKCLTYIHLVSCSNRAAVALILSKLETVQFFNLSSSAPFLCSSCTGDWQCSTSVSFLARYLSETFS